VAHGQLAGMRSRRRHWPRVSRAAVCSASTPSRSRPGQQPLRLIACDRTLDRPTRSANVRSSTAPTCDTTPVASAVTRTSFDQAVDCTLRAAPFRDRPCSLRHMPDGPRNLSTYTKQAGLHGGSGYPMLRLVALVACGTRTLIDAVFGPISTGEHDYTRRLTRSLHAGMLVLLDRNFDVAALIATLAATNAHLLVRLKANRKLPVLHHYHDGSYLSQIGTTRVRVVECEITIATAAGRHTGLYRLATTLLDHHRHPAAALVTLYHERWEIETCYLEPKSTVLGSRVLRARTPAGIAQEVYALLPDPAHRDRRRRPHSRRHRPRPGQLHHRPVRRPRPAHPGRRRHHRHHRRPHRRHRPTRAEQPATRPAATPQPPHRQTRDLQI
jgi:Transposase DDE domain